MPWRCFREFRSESKKIFISADKNKLFIKKNLRQKLFGNLIFDNYFLAIFSLSRVEALVPKTSSANRSTCANLLSDIFTKNFQ